MVNAICTKAAVATSRRRRCDIQMVWCGV
jgi:hypothetical protein